MIITKYRIKYFSCKTGIKPRNATSMVKKKKITSVNYFLFRRKTLWHLVMIKDYVAEINNMRQANGQEICPRIKSIYMPGVAKMSLVDNKSIVIQTVPS